MKHLMATEIQFPFGIVPAAAYEDVTPQGGYIRIVVDTSKMDDAQIEQIIRNLAGTDEGGIAYFLKQAQAELRKDPGSGYWDATAEQRTRMVDARARDLYTNAKSRSFNPVAILTTTTGEYITYSRKMSTSDTYLRQLGHDALIFTVSTPEGNALSIEEARKQAEAVLAS